MKKWIVCILGIVLTGCVSSSKNTDSGVIVLDGTNVTDKTRENFDLSAWVKDWDFAVLEQNDSCQLSKIRQIKIVGEDVFVVNVEELRSDIYRFTTAGQFRNRIGRPVSGYGFVTNTVIDSLNRKIYLLDIFESSVHLYDYEGEYLRSYRPYPLLQYVADAVCLGDNEILGYYGITRDHRLAYFTADSLLLVKDTLSYYEVGSGNPGVFNFSQNAISHYDGRVLLIRPFCDTIFEYRDRCLRPAFITETGASLPVGYQLENVPDCIGVKSELEAKGYFPKSGIFETDSHIWVGGGANRLMYDKQEGRGIYFRDSLCCHPDVFPPLDFIGRKGEFLVALASGGEILEIREAMKRQGMEPDGKLKELFGKVGEEDYVLFFYLFG